MSTSIKTTVNYYLSLLPPWYFSRVCCWDVLPTSPFCIWNNSSKSCVGTRVSLFHGGCDWNSSTWLFEDQVLFFTDWKSFPVHVFNWFSCFLVCRCATPADHDAASWLDLLSTPNVDVWLKVSYNYYTFLFASIEYIQILKLWYSYPV